MLDPHGNYVIQKALSCAEKKVQDIMIENLTDIIPDLRLLFITGYSHLKIYIFLYKFLFLFY